MPTIDADAVEQIALVEADAVVDVEAILTRIRRTNTNAWRKVDGNATTGEVAFVTAVGVLRAAFLGEQRWLAADHALANHFRHNGEVVAVTFRDVATNATRRGAADAARDIARTGGVNADTLTALGAIAVVQANSSGGLAAADALAIEA